MLHEFVTLNRENIIARCRAKVAQRSDPPPTEAEINHGVPLFLDQLVVALRSGKSNTGPIDAGASLHGHDLLLQGLTVSQVVHDYGDICQSITELAVQTHAPISTDEFRMLNRCLDDAIASAVTTYQRDSQPDRVDTADQGGPDRLFLLTREVRSLLGTAVIAFDTVKAGNVGVRGSTGAVLNSCLLRSMELMTRVIDETHLKSGELDRRPIPLREFIKGIGAAAAAAAHAQGVKLVVPPVPDGLTIEADRQILAAVLDHLLQNAFVFTRPNSTVTLTVAATADRIRIEIQDECGGRLGSDEKSASHPFTLPDAGRSGLGIGLAFCRSGVESNGGRLDVRNRAKGCVSAVDLPRSLEPANSSREVHVGGGASH